MKETNTNNYTDCIVYSTWSTTIISASDIYHFHKKNNPAYYGLQWIYNDKSHKEKFLGQIIIVPEKW